MSDSVPHKSGRGSYSYSALAFLIIFVVGLYASFTWESQQLKIKRAQALSQAQSYSFQLKSLLDHNLSGNYTLAALVHEFGGFTRWFPQVADSLLQVYSEVNNFALSPNGIVKQVYPLRGNERVIGFNQLMDVEQGSDAWDALKQQRMTLAGPVDLVQGGQGFVGRLPVTLERRSGGAEQFWGFSNVVIRLDALLENINLQALVDQGYAYRLERIDTEQAQLIATVSEGPLSDPVQVEMSLPGVKWRLQVAPAKGWLPPYMIALYAVLCFLLAAVVARFVYMTLKISTQKEQLTELLSLQTEHANQTDKRFLSTLQAIPDPLLELDQDGTVLDLHMPNDELELEQFFIPGQHYNKALPYAVGQVLEHVFQETLSSPNFSHRGALFSLNISAAKVLWFELSVVFRRTQEDDLANGRFIVLLRDVTARQEAEQQQRIAATAFETQDGILISDHNNHIIRVNKAFQKLSGYSEAEVIGQTPAILQSGKHDSAFYQHMFEQLLSKGTWAGEVWNRRKDGEVYPEWLSISTVRDHQGAISHYVANFKDISERKASERQIRQLHYYDSLTRLANRTLLLEEMAFLLEDKALRNKQSAVLFIDLDHFKDVNDVWGHNIGDQLLQQVATRLVDTTRSKDLVARFGGDEFLVLMEPTDTSINADRAIYRASHVADKLLKVLGRAFSLNGVDYQLAASIGITVFDEDCHEPLDIIKQAELAMYEAKSAGRSRHCFYETGMQERVLERVQLETDLRQALDNDELLLHFQPQWDAQQKMVGAEALLRWQHPERGMVSPAAFIPLAEETRLILPIGEWVLRSACQWLSHWCKHGQMQGFVMSVNVSAVQFSQENFVGQVQSILQQFKVPAGALQLELTESMLAHDQQDIISKMSALKALGVLISLDDFGTGYSSLSYLHRLPIDQLKIDQSFVANIEHGEKNASLAESIISLGHNLGMEVIAEGVETKAQFDWLAAQECDLFQGFGLAKPMPMTDLLRQYQDVQTS
ncbi:Cyclic di-GMP phosphodiesterase Gmr [Marinomonas aquimarina]|uniref:cyclic-guanylate-specific phosphodiesterase n=1 Tax=Marinomonas aquimarina TaxID=295068 RepID=A0A1A8TQG9_9GAMM|nr:EAL domain-containing protein [Marinomonas aquimarina]SBS35684.1 Cyclic di-GMP phosphodiesterase Gmr [Marinomonas aquimarina]